MSEHKMPEPVAWVAVDTLNSPHPTCISSRAYMSQLDRERGREYVPLYAAPVAAQKADDARDAERYRWLRKHLVNWWPGDDTARLSWHAREVLDAEIDAAMNASA